MYIVSSSAIKIMMGIYDGYDGTFIFPSIIFHDINFIFILYKYIFFLDINFIFMFSFQHLSFSWILWDMCIPKTLCSFQSVQLTWAVRCQRGVISMQIQVEACDQEHCTQHCTIWRHSVTMTSQFRIHEQKKQQLSGEGVCKYSLAFSSKWRQELL